MENILIEKVNQLLQCLLNQGLNDFKDTIEQDYLNICKESFEKINSGTSLLEVNNKFSEVCRKLIIKSCLFLQKQILNIVLALYNKNLTQHKTRVNNPICTINFS